MCTVNYSLIDKPDSEKDFDTVEQAVHWIRNIGPDMFYSVSLTDAYENFVEGYSDIIKVYELNSDLWAGSADCIHLHTESGWGGGCHCTTCRAWFCY